MGWVDFCIEDNTLIRCDRVLTKYIGNDEHVIVPDDVLFVGEDTFFEKIQSRGLLCPQS